MLCLSGCCDIAITGSADRGGQGFTISFLNFDGYAAVDAVHKGQEVAASEGQSRISVRTWCRNSRAIFSIDYRTCRAIKRREVFVSCNDHGDAGRQIGSCR